MSLKRGAMRNAMLFIVIAVGVKFLLDGVTLTLAGTTFDFGHVDSLAYAALLTPVLGAHSYTAVRIPPETQELTK